MSQVSGAGRRRGTQTNGVGSKVEIFASRDLGGAYDVNYANSAYRHPRRDPGGVQAVGAHGQINVPAHDVHTGPAFFSNAREFYIENAHMSSTSIYAGGCATGLVTLLQNSAPAAEYNSKDRSYDTPKCDEDTRIGLLEEMGEWSRQHNPAFRMLCLTGSAGSGKSALAQTFAESCANEKILLASFFFYISDTLRNNPDRFVASLAYQVTQSLEAAAPHIIRAVEKDPGVFRKGLEAQVEVLLIRPIQEALRTTPSLSPYPYVIVIDGLDECQGSAWELPEELQAQTLRIIHRCTQELPLRVFLTSRPEFAIRNALSDSPSGYLHGRVYHILLNDHDATEDIKRYFERRLRAIGRANRDETWPLQWVIDLLVQYASGHFIYAATVVKSMSDRRRSPFQRLQLVLDSSKEGLQQGHNPFASLDSLYARILNSAQVAYNDSVGSDPDSGLPFTILWGIRCLRALTSLNGFITREAVEAFLDWDVGESERIVEDLHSVGVRQVYTPTVISGSEETILCLALSFYHKSFSDYLDNPGRCHGFYLPRYLIYADLATIALNHISSAAAGGFTVNADAEKPHGKPCATPSRVSIYLLPRLLLPAVIFDRSTNRLPMSFISAPNHFCACGTWRYLTKAYMETERLAKEGASLWQSRMEDWSISNVLEKQIQDVVEEQHLGVVSDFFAFIESKGVKKLNGEPHVVAEPPQPEASTGGSFLHGHFTAGSNSPPVDLMNWGPIDDLQREFLSPLIPTGYATTRMPVLIADFGLTPSPSRYQGQPLFQARGSSLSTLQRPPATPTNVPRHKESRRGRRGHNRASRAYQRG